MSTYPKQEHIQVLLWLRRRFAFALSHHKLWNIQENERGRERERERWHENAPEYVNERVLFFICF